MKAKIILHKGQSISFRDMMEAVIGEWIAGQMPYFENTNDLDPFGDWFEGDADYEIKIIRKRGKGKKPN